MNVYSEFNSILFNTCCFQNKIMVFLQARESVWSFSYRNIYNSIKHGMLGFDKLYNKVLIEDEKKKYHFLIQRKRSR